MSVGFCIDCGLGVGSFDGLNCCPNCKSTNTPCLNEQQFLISINVQELRLICMWAERWGLEKVKDAGTVYSVVERIRKQIPQSVCLTIADEIQELQKAFGKNNVEHNFPGIE